MRVGFVSLACVLVLSGCQIASSTHGGDRVLAYPERSSLQPLPLPVRTLSIEEQIAPPAQGPEADLGKPLPTYQPFLSPASKPKPVRVAALDGDVPPVGTIDVGSRDLPMLAPLPVVDVTSIREALSRSVEASAAPTATSAPTPVPAVAQPAGGLY